MPAGGLICAIPALTVGALGFYLYKLSARLRGPAISTGQFLTTQDLDKVSYKDIDLLNNVPRGATGAGYAIIGGSGFVGSYLVRLLLLRGETYIRIVDIVPPDESLMAHPAVSFVKTDITSLESVRAALTQAFPSSSKLPEVLYHTAANIHFYERRSYCWQASYKVNVRGTENIIAVAQELTNAILIYTSTGDTVIPRPRILRLGYDTLGGINHKVVVSDYDRPISPRLVSQSCYSRSKIMAEELVKKADGRHTLRTGILRPAYTITGPNDRLITMCLFMKRIPVWDAAWSATTVCVWDVASAHLLMEDALRREPEAHGGQAFLVTGRGPGWTMKQIRETVKYYAKRPVVLEYVPILPIYILAHIMEAFLYLRYHILSFLLLPLGVRPSISPSWLGQGIYLQPSTLEYLATIEIDDSRARKMLGYRPQWDLVSCIKYTVEEVESGRTKKQHGLELKKL